MIEVVFVTIYAMILTLLNSFYVLFTGKYWNESYKINLGFLRLSTKIGFFIYGLTDKYPGFNFSTKDFTLIFAKPNKPNRFYAVPIIGFIVRIILLIPYLIYDSVIRTGALIGLLVSAFSVLINKKYPESIFEIGRDSTRVNLAASIYLFGLSDAYPSFSISMNHRTTKLILIVIGAILTAMDYFRELLFVLLR